MSNFEQTTEGFARYCVEDSGRTIESIWTQINEAVYYGHSHEDSTIKSEPLSAYDELLGYLSECGIETVPFAEVDFSSRPPDDRVTCLIRHDLDVDVVAALRMSKLEKKHGVKSSYYILHTGPYYGEFSEGMFYRHGGMRHIYRMIQENGQETGIHTDALHVYQSFGIDGAEALVTELAWMRAAGLKIRGSAAHNSHPVYGAENYAIFKGRPLQSSLLGQPCPNEIFREGKHTPLQVLDEGALGLDYEVNQIFWQNSTPVRYAALRAVNRWRWVDNAAQKKGAGLGGPTDFINQDELYANIARVPKGEWLVLAIHPVYYGYRHAPHSDPSRKGLRIAL